jgi:hypothetical protein
MRSTPDHMPTPRESPRTQVRNLLRSTSRSPQPRTRILSDVILAVPLSKWLRWCPTIGSNAGRRPGGGAADRTSKPLKQELSNRLQRELEVYVPALSGKIDYTELSTPLSTRHFMNYQRGESYGLSGTPERFRLRCLTPRTPIRDLYLTGQDVVSLGVTGALMSGVVTASALLRRNLMATLVKRAPKRAATGRTNRQSPKEQPAVA